MLGNLSDLFEGCHDGWKPFFSSIYSSTGDSTLGVGADVGSDVAGDIVVADDTFARKFCPDSWFTGNRSSKEQKSADMTVTLATAVNANVLTSFLLCVRVG